MIDMNYRFLLKPCDKSRHLSSLHFPPSPLLKTSTWFFFFIFGGGGGRFCFFQKYPMGARMLFLLNFLLQKINTYTQNTAYTQNTKKENPCFCFFPCMKHDWDVSPIAFGGGDGAWFVVVCVCVCWIFLWVPGRKGDMVAREHLSFRRQLRTPTRSWEVFS